MPIKHGYTHRGFAPRVYTAWLNMKRRCLNPNHESFKNYGARGITVCERWLDFKNFVDDVGEPPPKMTLERVDNSKGYEPGNVEWRSRKVQAQNTRRNRIFTVRGKTACLKELCEFFHVSYVRVRTRLDRAGWPIEAALFMPLCKGKKITLSTPPKLPSLSSTHKSSR